MKKIPKHKRNPSSNSKPQVDEEEDEAQINLQSLSWDDTYQKKMEKTDAHPKEIDYNPWESKEIVFKENYKSYKLVSEKANNKDIKLFDSCLKYNLTNNNGFNHNDKTDDNKPNVDLKTNANSLREVQCNGDSKATISENKQINFQKKDNANNFSIDNLNKDLMTAIDICNNSITHGLQAKKLFNSCEKTQVDKSYKEFIKYSRSAKKKLNFKDSVMKINKLIVVKNSPKSKPSNNFRIDICKDANSNYNKTAMSNKPKLNFSWDKICIINDRQIIKDLKIRRMFVDDKKRTIKSEKLNQSVLAGNEKGIKKSESRKDQTIFNETSKKETIVHEKNYFAKNHNYLTLKNNPNSDLQLTQNKNTFFDNKAYTKAIHSSKSLDKKSSFGLRNSTEKMKSKIGKFHYVNKEDIIKESTRMGSFKNLNHTYNENNYTTEKVDDIYINYNDCSNTNFELNKSIDDNKSTEFNTGTQPQILKKAGYNSKPITINGQSLGTNYRLHNKFSQKNVFGKENSHSKDNLSEMSVRISQIKQDSQKEAIWGDRKAIKRPFLIDNNILLDEKSLDTISVNIHKNIMGTDEDLIVIKGEESLKNNIVSVKNMDKKAYYPMKKGFNIATKVITKNKLNITDTENGMSTIIGSLKGNFDNILLKNKKSIVKNYNEQNRSSSEFKPTFTNNKNLLYEDTELVINNVKKDPANELKKQLVIQPKTSLFKTLNNVLLDSSDRKQKIYNTKKNDNEKNEFNNRKSLPMKLDPKSDSTARLENSQNTESKTIKVHFQRNLYKTNEIDPKNTNKTQSFQKYFKRIASTKND